MIEAYLKQVIEDSVRKVVKEELQKTSELKISQPDQEVLEALRAKRTIAESDWEGNYLSREEWEEIAVRYVRGNKINYEIGRKAVDIANGGGVVQNLGSGPPSTDSSTLKIVADQEQMQANEVHVFGLGEG